MTPVTSSDPAMLAWREWCRTHSSAAEEQQLWMAAYRQGVRDGVRQSARLGLSTTVQQFSEMLERLERMVATLAEDERGSDYWRTEDA